MAETELAGRRESAPGTVIEKQRRESATVAAPVRDELDSSRPGAPRTPRDGALVEGSSVTLTWTPVDGATEYHLQIAPDAAFAHPVFDAMVAEAHRLDVFEMLPENGATFYWRTRARVQNDWRSWSDAATFRAVSDHQMEAIAQQEAQASADVRRRQVQDERRQQRVSGPAAGAAVAVHEPEYVPEASSDREMQVIFTIMLLAFAVTFGLIAWLAP